MKYVALVAVLFVISLPIAVLAMIVVAAWRESGRP